MFLKAPKHFISPNYIRRAFKKLRKWVGYFQIFTLRALSFCLINNTKTVVYFTTQKINVQRFISKLGMFTQYRTTMLFLAGTCMLPIEKYVLDKHMY